EFLLELLVEAILLVESWPQVGVGDPQRDDYQRVPVRGEGIVSGAGALLGAFVLLGSGLVARVLDLDTQWVLLGQSKVYHHEGGSQEAFHGRTIHSGVSQHYVGRLEIVVHDAIAMHVVHRPGHVLKHSNQQWRRVQKVASLFDRSFEVAVKIGGLHGTVGRIGSG